MKPSKEAIEAYKEMAKASPASMKTMIEENLKATCDKYAGHEDRLVFTLGYPKVDDTERRLVFKNPRIRIGTGKPEWGA